METSGKGVGRGNRNRHKSMVSTTMRAQVNKANQPEEDMEMCCNISEKFISAMNVLTQSITKLKEEVEDLKKLKPQVEALQMRQNAQQLKINTVAIMANKSIDLIETLQIDQDTMKSKLEAVEKGVKILSRKNDLMLGVLIHQNERIHNYTMKLTDLHARGMMTNIIIYGLEKRSILSIATCPVKPTTNL